MFYCIQYLLMAANPIIIQSKMGSLQFRAAGYVKSRGGGGGRFRGPKDLINQNYQGPH